jgi:FkbM family methyltransferase
MLASAMRGTGHVFAFEPNQATYARLQTNIALNNLDSAITAIRCGLSDTPRVAFLKETEGNSGATIVSDEPTAEPIMLETLDGFCAKQNIDYIDIIKIDVEGNELQVLEGGRAVLSKNRPVLMIEFNPCALEGVGSSAGELAKLLGSWGYQLLVATRGRLAPLQSLPARGVIMNVFCLPNPQARAFKEVA